MASFFPTEQNLIDTTTFIQTKSGSFRPSIAFILGTGLGGLVDHFDPSPPKIVIPYSEIPNFPKCTVPEHAGNLVLGCVSGVKVVCMQGRFHRYEGYTLQQCTFPVRVFAKLGVKCLIVSNASGAINTTYKVGDIMVIRDHVNLIGSPLVGPNCDFFPPHSSRFLDMGNCYSEKLRKIVKEEGEKRGVQLVEGVYCCLTGPEFQTKAESQLLLLLGCDCVGMSTAPEVVVGCHSGLECLGFSIVTDLSFGDSPPDHASISAISSSASLSLLSFLSPSLPLILSSLEKDEKEEKEKEKEKEEEKGEREGEGKEKEKK